MATKKTAIKTTAKSKVSSVKSAAKTTTATVRSPRSKKTATPKKHAEMNVSEIESSSSDAPKTRIITKKYLYAVAGVIVLIGLLFIASRFWVVAWVDNRPITKFELYGLLEKRDQGKTAEELIVQKLLVSEGQKQRQSVTEAEIQAEITKIEGLQGGAAQLDQILQINNTTREDFKKLVELQLLKQKLFGGNVNVTDEQVNKYIEDNKDALPPDALANPQSSEAAQLRQNVKDQLQQTQIQENFNKWLNEALNSSRVMRIAPAPTQPSALQNGQ